MKQLPESFGPYAVLEQIGIGGMGTIYRALDTRLEREVALKVLHRNLDVSGARERFLNEARVVSSLNHPNICTIFDLGEQGDDLYLVMEMLHGQSLKERIAAGPASAEEIRDFALQAAMALQAAHACSVVHRDIKPANLFLHIAVPRPCVKVLDFGLAKIERGSSHQRAGRGLTRHGATVGTAEYMSPEQACGYPIDSRSDLFSLGAVLYEMATGKAPFHGATSAIIYSKLLNQEPTPPRDANLNLPEDLDRIIRHLLQKERNDRIQTAAELVHELGAGDTGDRSCSMRVGSTASEAARRPDPETTANHTGVRMDQAMHRIRPRCSRRSSLRPTRLAVRSALLCLIFVLLVASVKLAWAGRESPSGFHGAIRIYPLFNGTGNNAFDNTSAEILNRELRSSGNYMTLIEDRQQEKAARVPQQQTPSASLKGSILPAVNGYAVRLTVRDNSGDTLLAEADELAPSTEQIPEALSRAALDLRQELKQGRNRP